MFSHRPPLKSDGDQSKKCRTNKYIYSVDVMLVMPSDLVRDTQLSGTYAVEGFSFSAFTYGRGVDVGIEVILNSTCGEAPARSKAEISRNKTRDVVPMTVTYKKLAYYV
jgi:hypothetical protein